MTDDTSTGPPAFHAVNSMKPCILTIMHEHDGKKSKVRGLICIAHRREAPLMRYRFPYVDADLHKPTRQPGISEHCETT